jgi:hypothetical protein
MGRTSACFSGFPSLRLSTTAACLGAEAQYWIPSEGVYAFFLFNVYRAKTLLMYPEIQFLPMLRIAYFEVADLDTVKRCIRTNEELAQYKAESIELRMRSGQATERSKTTESAESLVMSHSVLPLP